MVAFTFLMCLCTVLANQADKFTELPSNSGDLPHQMPSDSYSGYLNVTDTKSLHYVFLSSQSDLNKDPLVIWFNGGPGCSSLLAFMQETGPWVINDGQAKIVQNPHPWNAKANMLYIESPAGVGFSWGGEANDLKHYDYSQSKDAFAALESFYVKFPWMIKNELFISGESYAGIYVPYLAWQVYQNNQQAPFKENKTHYNLQGYLVGNGAADWDFDVSPSFPTTMFDFSLIPRHLYQNYTLSGCKVWFNDFRPRDGPAYCTDLWNEINKLAENLNWYDLYRPVYGDGGLTADKEERYGKTVINGVEHKYKRGYTQSEYTPWANFPKKADEAVYGAGIADYFNKPEVREALNIWDKVQPWEMCNGNGNWTYNYTRQGSKWIYPILKAAGVRQIFFSGDTDGAVPFSGTRQWIKELNYPIRRPWQPWYTTKDVNPEVAGYVVSYEGLDFATIHGVGHMAPQWARQSVQTMFFNWIENKDWEGLIKSSS